MHAQECWPSTSRPRPAFGLNSSVGSSIIRRVRSLLALALGVAALGFSSGPEAERPTGRFVFVGQEDVLWTMRADGTGARRVTHSHYVAESEPEWSPGGRKIAYSRGDRCHTDPSEVCNRIWTVNADGSDARRLIPQRLPGLLANRAVSFQAPRGRLTGAGSPTSSRFGSPRGATST
jgi:hypothetical protein